MGSIDWLKRSVEYESAYSDYWTGKGDWYWFRRLLEEVMELLGVLLAIHPDPIEHELAQIASIARNWIRHQANKSQ